MCFLCISRFVDLWLKKNLLILNENIFSSLHSRCNCDWLPFSHCFDMCEVSASIKTHTNVCAKFTGRMYTASLHKILNRCLKKNIYFDKKNIWKHKIYKQKKQQEYVKHVEKHEVTVFFRAFLVYDAVNKHYKRNIYYTYYIHYTYYILHILHILQNKLYQYQINVKKHQVTFFIYHVYKYMPLTSNKNIFSFCHYHCVSNATTICCWVVIFDTCKQQMKCTKYVATVYRKRIQYKFTQNTHKNI